MADEREEVVRDGLAAIDRRDLPGILKQLDPKIELQPLLSVWQGAYSGHAGIEQWWADAGELWEDFGATLESFRDLGGGTVVVTLQWRGRPKGGADQFEGPAAALVRFRGTKVLAIEVHLDEARALQAAEDS